MALTRIRLLGYFLALLLTFSAAAAPKALGANIGVVFDGPSEKNRKTLAEYEKEINDLTAGEFTVSFPPGKIITADWTAEGVRAALGRLLSDPSVDIVIALGIISSTELSGWSSFPKPVIAPWVIDTNLLGLTPGEDGGSGIRNFYYISRTASFDRDLAAFKEAVGFERLAVIYMPMVMQLAPGIETVLRRSAAANGIEIELVPASGSAAATAAAIPAGAEAVFVTPLLDYSQAEMKRLYEDIAQRKLPSFSVAGKNGVDEGALMGLAPAFNPTREARRVALVVQSILLGQDPGNFPVVFDAGSSLSINMATARAVGFNPTWDILTEAVLVNDRAAEAGRKLTLEQAASESVEVNLDLLAAGEFVAAGAQDVRLALAQLLPQSDIFVDNTYIDKDRAEASLGTQPQRDISVGGNLRQLIYSEKAWSNLTVQKRIQESREFTRDEIELDIIAATSIGYLNVLRTKTIENIQKENLKLSKSNLGIARIRRDIGVASPAEVYRWESRISSDRIEVVNAEAQRKNTEILVNRLLHRPQGEAFTTVETGLDDPSLLASDPRLRKYLNTPEAFGIFMDFVVSRGLVRSPAIQAINSQMEAQDRILTSTRRAFWSPTIVAFGELRQFVYEGGAGSSIDLPPGFPLDLPRTDDTDWVIQLQASFPLFTGGAKIADYRKARSELSRLTYEKESTSERVEESIRTSLNNARASYPSIGFALDAADAAKKNLDIVTDSYSRGVASIIDLLDAQNAALSAELNAANAVYNFLIDLMNVQRASGKFDFFTTVEDREEFFRNLEQYYETAGADVRGE
ncbi:MAG: TolC family protein [Candidatus Dadabacteria bacterium]|nr:TolC family protein [Candidatus Dadabacteria bacterium]